MCGIVGYTGPREAGPILMEGLRRLEYRGYDSAGIALVDDQGDLFVEKRAGKLGNLRTAIAERTPHAAIGSRTRAGRPTAARTTSTPTRTWTAPGEITVIHNGIIENFQDLRDGLEARGHKLVSETDTEAIAHLIEEAYQGDIADATRAALRQLEGAYALAIMHRDENDAGWSGRARTCPWWSGWATARASSRRTSRRSWPTPTGSSSSRKATSPTCDRGASRSPMSRAGGSARVGRARSTEPIGGRREGRLRHFMLKEIHEQPEALRQSLTGRISLADRIQAAELRPIERQCSRRDAPVEMRGVGTASYASLLVARPMPSRPGPASPLAPTSAPSSATARRRSTSTRWSSRSPSRRDRRHDRPDPPRPRTGLPGHRGDEHRGLGHHARG